MAGKRVRHAFAASSRQLRLGPEDGTRRHPDERGVTMRDRGGNKLVDIVDIDSGFCTGVTSPLTDDVFPIRPAKPVVPKKGRWSDLGDSGIPEKVGTLYVDFEGRRVRTCDMGDQPMTQARIDAKAERAKLKQRATQSARDKKQAERAAKQSRKLSRHAQGCVDEVKSSDRKPRAQVASVPRDLCVLYIKSKYGPNVPITDEAIRAARTILRKAGVKG